jgi:adenylate cyclase
MPAPDGGPEAGAGGPGALTLSDLGGCFSGLVPAVIATVSAKGIPNVTYISRAHPLGDDHVALTNQFLSKSSRNLAEVPRASVLLVRPENHEEYRLDLGYERTERRGPVFERLRNDLSMVAALTGMQDVFRLASADVFRVLEIEQLTRFDVPEEPVAGPGTRAGGPGHAELGELCGRLSRCGDLDVLLRVTVDGLDDLLGYGHSQLLLLDEEGTRLFTIASHGYDAAGIGAEVALGEGVAGAAAAACAPVNVGNVSQATKYARSIRRSFEEQGIGPGREVPLVGLARPGSQLAVPALALGQLVGVLLVEDERGERFTAADAAMLTAVTSIVASSIESLRAEVRTAGAVAAGPPAAPVPQAASEVLVRHFVVDGSTFLDGDYLIKGVAGRLLWSLLRQHETEARTEFTNREVRLDKSLDLPDFRDNFESRLIMLKRRLDERAAPVRIEKTGRGRFRLEVSAPLRLQSIAD